MIHPTALIHPRAQIGPDCEIGPYCVIGEHVELGAGCRLHAHVVVDGHTRLGRQNVIYPFASIGLQTQDLKWKGGVTRTEIGDHNTIRECVTIHSATGDGEATVIGSHNNILASSHLGHNVVIGNHVIISMAGVAGHVVVEDYALVGGMSGVHQFCRIGKMAIVGGCSRIPQDVAPFMLVEGNPPETRMINKIGLERNGVPAETQAALKQAHKILFREGLTTSNALARIEQELPPLPEVQYLVRFVRASERGIIK
ncbi:MAG TPA: acyl-ACP--UDP-N-acetylglucosamine O-acyltransferase [Verrucomicrobiota bacterium]|jgi:UDP-N-acetylglucosamine acyltransferase|nr:acyl-ACP--UDP-N-acetylglucosamine O-acyltransferase [Verrucomicrobiota bacterium]OQC24662.1 MAG: Acyl-(acyl-carrier-protein)--UDP-N-acetylglucosamine O-acyltransferase [Verrucomicrobia bacterium ADurb.Bin063]HCL91530.1 acyl-[acyl-carrier-protein]--UDP-N-acetylglucosamine O-acyltransferase [Limisphaerales bacterium]HRR65122.1 acyl-ACP--UDP-N-acetylglucosamine O-acyltransferase [Candidatus Paceibacterota bacterium]MBP8014706.1 acyl-ACP--UDP-N-acetylglucosamine O-acyltransferase [Verrucomicrobi